MTTSNLSSRHTFFFFSSAWTITSFMTSRFFCGISCIIKGQPLFSLFLKILPKYTCGHPREAFNLWSNTAFVCQIRGEAGSLCSWQLGSCSANEDGAENESIFWSVIPCLWASGNFFFFLLDPGNYSDIWAGQVIIFLWLILLCVMPLNFIHVVAITLKFHPCCCKWQDFLLSCG